MLGSNSSCIALSSASAVCRSEGDEVDEGACSDCIDLIESERERYLGRRFGDPRTGDGGAWATRTGERADELGDRCVDGPEAYEECCLGEPREELREGPREGERDDIFGLTDTLLLSFLSGVEGSLNCGRISCCISGCNGGCSRGCTSRSKSVWSLEGLSGL